MAIPAIQTLHSQGLLHSIGVPEGNIDIVEFCAATNIQSAISLTIFKKEKFALELDMWMTSGMDYVFTMTFPWKIPSALIDKHQRKLYNFHYGLLPQMRGADPVFEALRQQCEETGITVHSIEKEIDKGSVMLQKVIPIDAFSTHGLLCTQLSYLGAQMLPQLLTLLLSGIDGTPQDETIAKYYKRPTAAEVCINWGTQDAEEIQALTRACNPWNKGAYTQWNGWNIRIVEATVLNTALLNNTIPGSILSTDNYNSFIVQCKGDTQLKIDFIYTDEGFMPGSRLFAFGVKTGEKLTSI